MRNPVAWWSLLMVSTESDPMHYADARSYYAAQVSVYGWPPAVARQRLRDLRAQLFRWIVAEVRFPVVLSMLSIPFLALFTGRSPEIRWAVTMLALVLAFVIPWGMVLW
jgi:hypothetical protein